MLSHDPELWHRLLHSTPFFLHLHLLLENFDLHEHLKNPWPSDKDCWDAASRTLIDVSQLSSSCKIKSCLQILISLAPNMPLSRPYRVSITAFPLSFTWKTNRETRTKRIENMKSPNYFSFWGLLVILLL